MLLAVYATADQVLLELPASLTEKTLQTIDRYLISEKAYFEASDDAFAILSVQGPAARTLLEGAAGVALELAPYAHARGDHRRGAGTPDQPRGGPRARLPRLGARRARRHRAGRPRGGGSGAGGRRDTRGAADRGGPALVSRRRRRLRDPARDAPRRAGELHQGLLHRPGDGGAREVSRPRQPRAQRSRDRGRASSRRGGTGHGGRQGGRPRHLRGTVDRAGPADRARLRAPRALRAGHRGNGGGWRRRAAGPGRGPSVRRAPQA